MTSKLTLSIEKEVVNKAKKYAQGTGRSLSELVENYLRKVSDEEVVKKGLSEKLKSIVGAVSLPDDFDEDKELRSYLEGKHF